MKICIPIRENDFKTALKQVGHAQKHADFVEIWLDCLPEADICKLIKVCGKPVIAVCKGVNEGGRFQGSEEEKIDRLVCALRCGAKFVDAGILTDAALLKNLKRECRKNRAQLILSHHFWKNTPEIAYLEKIIKKAKSLGADIVKIATTVNNWSDNVVLFELTKIAVQMGIKIIVIGMGERGKISRIGCPILGSYLAYVALDDKSKTASGQMVLKLSLCR